MEMLATSAVKVSLRQARLRVFMVIAPLSYLSLLPPAASRNAPQAGVLLFSIETKVGFHRLEQKMAEKYRKTIRVFAVLSH
jgi:hypothetical protein